MDRAARPHGSIVAAAALLVAGCAEAGSDPPRLRFTVVTINTGTTDGLEHDEPPDDGYGSAEAAISDAWYGDGLAWPAAIADVRRFFETVSPDVAAFQEMFHSPACEAIPPEHHAGFVCESWQSGDPTVIEVVLGDGYQVACHLGKPDKCVAVHERFGTIRGCDAALCLDGLAGAQVPDCGSGSRVGRAVIDLVAGGSVTVAHVHGTSGLADADVACRRRQFEQIFVDLGIGDGAGANGELNVVLGDLNTDPARAAVFDASAAFFAAQAGPDRRFHFVTAVGPEAPPTYLGFNIDHVVSDGFAGSCWHAGTEGHPPVSEMVYFDHRPAVCTVEGG
jgi:hypothetical protein